MKNVNNNITRRSTSKNFSFGNKKQKFLDIFSFLFKRLSWMYPMVILGPMVLMNIIYKTLFNQLMFSVALCINALIAGLVLAFINSCVISLIEAQDLHNKHKN